MTSLLRSLASRLSTYGQNILFRQDHFAPHEGAGFEGYYSRTQLKDGSTLAVIFCWVKNAPQRPNLVHVSYTPSPSSHSSLPAFKHEFFPERHEISSGKTLRDSQRPFAVHMPGVGTMKVNGDTAEYLVEVPDTDLHLSLTLTQRLPWSSTHRLAGPMGIFSAFSSLLPLNWHVHSTSSKASYSITHSGTTLSGTGATHFEKNWGTSFPPGWIWSQSFAGDGERTRSLCLAGGCALPGVQAYLLGYRSPSLHWDFRPPFTVGVGPISPFIDVAHDSKAGTFRLTVQTFTRKLAVRVNASPDSFLGIAAPYADGHRPNYAFESFSGSTWVEAWGRTYPWQSWTLLEEGDCGVTSSGSPCSALEFGGSFSHLIETENVKNR